MDTDNKAETRGKGQGVSKKDLQNAPSVIYYITDGAHTMAERVRALFPEARMMKFTSSGASHELPLLWNTCGNLIFIMATGIVVRAIAPLVKDKRSDPAVVVLDEKGEFAISLLSGHIGGANALAREIADYLGARAVITTASDVQGKVALDIWASEKNLMVEDFQKLKELSARIVNGDTVSVFSELTIRPESVPSEFRLVDAPEQADIIISSGLLASEALFMRPGNLVAGIGCNRGTPKEEIASAVAEIMREEHLSLHSIRRLATIDLKRDEQGLLAYALDKNLDIAFFSVDALNHTALHNKLARSQAAQTATGAVAVAEPAALLAAGQVSDQYRLIVTKQKRGNVTLAIAQAEFIL